VKLLPPALRELNEGGGPPKLVVEVVAQRIIAAASNGERDPVRLRRAALARAAKRRRLARECRSCLGGGRDIQQISAKPPFS